MYVPLISCGEGPDDADTNVKMANTSPTSDTAGLSFISKMFFASLIVGGCYAFIQMQKRKGTKYTLVR